jgi:hypothetical protein
MGAKSDIYPQVYNFCSTTEEYPWLTLFLYLIYTFICGLSAYISKHKFTLKGFINIAEQNGRNDKSKQVNLKTKWGKFFIRPVKTYMTHAVWGPQNAGKSFYWLQLALRDCCKIISELFLTAVLLRFKYLLCDNRSANCCWGLRGTRTAASSCPLLKPKKL